MILHTQQGYVLARAIAQVHCTQELMHVVVLSNMYYEWICVYVIVIYIPEVKPVHVPDHHNQKEAESFASVVLHTVDGVVDWAAAVNDAVVLLEKQRQQKQQQIVVGTEAVVADSIAVPAVEQDTAAG